MKQWSLGGVKGSDINMIPSIIASWQPLMEVVADAGAETFKKSIDEVFELQGSPEPWKPNKETTVNIKGEGKRIMENTGALRNAVEIRRHTEFQTLLQTGASRGIGWFDKFHPTADLDGNPLTFGELAWINELGMVSF